MTPADALRGTARSLAHRVREAAGHDPRVRLALMATAALVAVALVATAVVVLTGRSRAGAVPPTDAAACSAMTRPVRYQLDAAGRTGLLTITDGAAEAARRAGYPDDQGVVFRAASRAAPGLVAVHQLRLGTRDQLWTTDAAEVREAVRSRGYLDQGVVAYVAKDPSACTLEVRRFRLRGLHRYATTQRQQDALRAAGWLPEGSFSAARPPAEPETPAASPSPTPSPAPDGPPAAIDARFDDVPVGRVTPESFIETVGGTNHDPRDYDSMTFVEQGDGSGSRFLRTHLSARTFLGRNDRRGDGNVIVVPLEDQSSDAACVTYRVRFSPGFDVSAGGKLPGLLGVAPGVSPATPTGGGSTDLGWSGRVMWLGPKLSGAVRASGRPDLAVSYLYHPGQAGRYGDDLSWGRGLVDGTWHEVRQCYRLNTVGRADGRLQAWVDGEPVLDRSDLVYRTSAKVHVTHLDWSVFRGGNTREWAGETGGDVDLDDLRVTVG